MINFLSVIAVFILIIFSIDDRKDMVLGNFKEITDYSNPSIPIKLSTGGRNFDYNDMSIEDIAKIRMPYINCNREIFCAKDFDLIDLFDLEAVNLKKDVFVGEGCLLYKLFFITTAIGKLCNYITDYNEKLDIYFISLKKFNEKLSNEFLCLGDILKNKTVPSKPKSNIYNLFVEIEKYLNGSSKNDIFSAFSRLKPSEFLIEQYNVECLTDREIVILMVKTIYFYKKVYTNIENLGKFKSIDQKGKVHTHGSLILTKNILFKWMDEISKHYIIGNNENKKDHKYMQLYSINANDILEDELVKVIENIIDEKIELHDSKCDLLSQNTGDLANLKIHVYEAANKKRYIFKIFELSNNKILPSGISTAYLNYKNGVVSLGYIGAVKKSTTKFDSIFISVEEEPSFYISVLDNLLASKIGFDCFGSNYSQAFYFVLDFLRIMKYLYLFKIKLNSRLIFGVDDSNNGS